MNQVTPVFLREFMLGPEGRRLLRARSKTSAGQFNINTEDDWKKLQKEFDAFKRSRFKAADFGWTSYHPLGTCKMGTDPKTSVVDPDHETHEIDRLFIVDGSTVPGPLGVNPQVTIMAMATRAAERIAERL
jgi:choline dehydrogenase-like flavoprotein